MKNWTVKRLVLIGFSSAAIIFALLLAITWHNAMRSRVIVAEIERGNNILASIGKLHTGLTDTVAAHRDAILNAGPEAEQRRVQSIEELEKSLEEAARLAADNPRQSAQIAQARDILAKRKQVFEYYRIIWQREGIAGVVKRLGKGEPLDAQFRQVLRQTRLDEMTTLQRLQIEAASNARSLQVACALLLRLQAVTCCAAQRRCTPCRKAPYWKEPHCWPIQA